MSFLKPKPATSSSLNTNNDLIKSTYGGAMGQGTAAMGDLSKMLGVGDPNGYNNYLQNAGFAPAMRQLSQNVTGQGAAAGILNSGSTARCERRAEIDKHGRQSVDSRKHRFDHWWHCVDFLRPPA
jgi:hypothetical protein